MNLAAWVDSPHTCKVTEFEVKVLENRNTRLSMRTTQTRIELDLTQRELMHLVSMLESTLNLIPMENK